MKKNLQKILVLALGLTTTIASAQFSATSLSRVNNTDSDNRTSDNRIALSADYGAVHVSADVSAGISATDGSSVDANYDIYEAYASTDVMGFGTLTVGRQDLSFGSGALLSGNDWGMDRLTEDGISFAMNLGGFDVNLGSLRGVANSENYMNASGNFGGADVNILMMSDSAGNKAHGYDLSYDMNNFSLSASMNSDYEGDELTTYGLSYSVTDQLTATFSRSSSGDTSAGDFNMDNTSYDGDHWANGNMGHISAGEEATTMGVSYDLGDITVSYSMSTVSDDDDATEDREVTIMSLSYQLNDNCNIGLARFSDTAEETTTGWDGGERTYLSIAIGL